MIFLFENDIMKKEIIIALLKNKERSSMCGVFGFGGSNDAVEKTLLGLFCLQHRGQESSGVAVWSGARPFGERVRYQKRVGYVSHLKEKLQKEDFSGSVAIGHVRYGTSGGPGLLNAHPLVRKIDGSTVSIVHNGDLVKVDYDGKTYTIDEFKNLLQGDGIPLETGSDTEIILHLIAKTRGDGIISRIISALNSLQGAFSVLILWEGYLIAARDPWGFRPLWFGRHNGGYVFSSEDYPFYQLNMTPIREVEPGEIIIITPDNVVVFEKISRQVKRMTHCSFEYVYFARPDSSIYGQSVSEVRKRFGRKLAQELLKENRMPEIDKIIPVLDSGGVSSLEFAQALMQNRIAKWINEGVLPERLSGNIFPFDFGLIRNHYSGRNFITPTEREKDVDLKHNINQCCVRGLKIASGDDSLVRGTTARKHAERYRRAGAKNVGNLIFSPPVKHSCFYGIDTKRQSELPASYKTIEEIRKDIKTDFLHYLSLEGFKECLLCPENFCTACFDGEYPI